MTPISKIILLSIAIISLNSCTKDIDKPTGSAKAKPVYNQAYQENYEADNIDDILKKAKNAYILLDPFDQNIAQHISTLKASNNEVGAYISIGTGETYRSDFSAMQGFLVSKQWSEWDGEYFVNTTSTGIIDVMKLRIDKIADWGFDWVEFDNMDWAFDDESRKKYGFETTAAEAIAYYNTLCDYVHQKGMKCMAKNTVTEAESFDGVLYESGAKNKNWWNTEDTKDFLDKEKFVIINHYNEGHCNKTYLDYMQYYNEDISFICEDRKLKKYVHFND